MKIREKIFLYPQTDWKTAVSLMAIPRYISSFETPEYSIGNFAIQAFLKQQIDIFLIANSFTSRDTVTKASRHSISASGDGNLSFSNGLSIKYANDNRTFFSSAGVQSRSCLLANDIRLFSPDPTVLIPNAKFITPAIDVMGNLIYAFNKKSNLSFDSLFEFTNMDAVLFSGSVSGKIGISELMNIGISCGINHQLKGVRYFWYPAQRKWVDIRFHYSDNNFSFGVMKMAMSGTTVNISYMREIF